MLHAFVEGDLALALRPHGILDDLEHVRGLEAERFHIEPGHEQDLECPGLHLALYASGARPAHLNTVYTLGSWP